MQADGLVGQMLPDHRHLQVRALRSTQLSWQCESVQPRCVGPAHHLDQQLLPGRNGDSAVLGIGARELAPVVEELRMLFLERDDLALDEFVDLDQQR